jgi:hypothetical protein
MLLAVSLEVMDPMGPIRDRHRSMEGARSQPRPSQIRAQSCDGMAIDCGGVVLEAELSAPGPLRPMLSRIHQSSACPRRAVFGASLLSRASSMSSASSFIGSGSGLMSPGPRLGVSAMRRATKSEFGLGTVLSEAEEKPPAD